MSLVEGSVDVTTSRPPYQSIRVKPNEKVVYNKRTGNLLHERTSNKMETAWINKELVFRSERLEVCDSVVCPESLLITSSVDDETLLNDRVYRYV